MLIAYHFAAAVVLAPYDGTALRRRNLSTALVVALCVATEFIRNHHIILDLMCLYRSTDLCTDLCSYHNLLCHLWRRLRHDHTWLLSRLDIVHYLLCFLPIGALFTGLIKKARDSCHLSVATVIFLLLLSHVN